MSLNPSSPVTGAAVTGLTSPTYTLTEDVNGPNNRVFFVTALGGTQTNVETHSASSPYSISISRPKTVKVLPRANAQGNYPSVPMNEYRVVFRKGCTINGTVVGVAQEVPITAELKIRLPAGFELSTNDPEEAKALFSLIGGFLYANASGLYDLVSTSLLK